MISLALKLRVLTNLKLFKRYFCYVFLVFHSVCAAADGEEVSPYTDMMKQDEQLFSWEGIVILASLLFIFAAISFFQYKRRGLSVLTGAEKNSTIQLADKLQLDRDSKAYHLIINDRDVLVITHGQSVQIAEIKDTPSNEA